MDGTADYFDAWPKPFPSREAAIDHFGGPSLLAEMWADGLEERDGGLWPRWDVEVMARTIREAFGRDYWEQWEAIRCPTLGGPALRCPKSEFEEMAARLPQLQFVELDGAKHDLHLDRPDEWRRALTAFLEAETDPVGRSGDPIAIRHTVSSRKSSSADQPGLPGPGGGPGART